jgi:hypothetical protein
MLWWLAVFVGLLAAGYYAYETGAMLARRDVTNLTAEVDNLETTVETLKESNVALETALQVERQRGEDWQKRYDANVPTGQRAAFLDLLNQRLEDGLTVERLTSLIQSARLERRCDESPVTKRFVVQSPLHSGANSFVSFADNRVTVTASGASAMNINGSPEGWYDPAKPITVRFAMLGGESVTAEGVLPLHHSVVAGGYEYLFSLVSGDRGFVTVTADRCAYP